MRLNKILPSVLENLSAVIIIIKPNLEIKFTSGNSEKLLTYARQDLIGKKIGQLFENNTAYNELIQEIKHLPKDQLATSSKELNILDANNNNLPVAVSLKKIGVGRKPLGFILIITDTSETKKYHKILEEKTLQLSEKSESLKKLQKEFEIEQASTEEKIKNLTQDFEKKHALLLASINDLGLCFLMTDKYNNIIFNNKAAGNIFPFLTPEKKITVTELQESSRMNLDLNTQIEKARNEKKSINLANVQIDSKFINILISPIILGHQQNPEALGITMIIKDQTTQHDLQLSKEDLFNIASHELRTPLTAIYGYTALVKQLYFGNIQNEELKMIINNIGILSKKLSLSVSNFLDSSKLEQGKIELKMDQHNLFTLIDESIKEMEDVALWKNLYIKFDPPPYPITITTDRIRITQILNILINNAIKFTGIGGIYISAETGSDTVKIFIKDTGTGISDENKKLLFRKFQRTGDNLLTRQEGTGLGLHVAKLLVEKMGGTIKLEKTELNKGSTFSFTIPMLNN